MARTSDSTTSIPADAPERTADRPSDEDFDALLQGLPEEQKAIKLERIADDAAAAAPGFREAPAGKVVLLNIKYENETFFVPEPDADNVARFVGQTRLTFVDGYLVCTREQADFVKARAAHVYEEPREGEILEFQQTGFKTRVPKALNEYAVRWADNQ